MYICVENFLPAEIQLDIFSRLPVESVLHCKQVCKTWRALLRDPCFAHMHLHRSQHEQLDSHSYNNHSNDFVSAKVSLIFLIKLKENRNHYYQLSYQEFDKNDELSYKRHTRINHPLLESALNIVGSCNGLICLASVYHLCNSSVFISNPITRECVVLPKLDIPNLIKEGYNACFIMCGFGYLPSTDEYKVVRIYSHLDNYDHSGSGECMYCTEVYTLGSGNGWRKNKYSSMPQVDSGRHRWGIFANGALHWKDSEGTIAYFDLANEELRFLPSRPYEDEDEEEENYWRLEVLGGQLCLVNHNMDHCMDIWSYKKNNNSTPSDMEVHEYQSWCWSKEFSIPVLNIHAKKPCAFTQSGEVLTWYQTTALGEASILTRYDSKTRTLRMFYMDFPLYRAIPHVNSFVSLKALEEDAKIIGSAEEILDSREVEA